MKEHEVIALRISSRIYDEWSKVKADMTKAGITFEQFKYVCLKHLDIASEVGMEDYIVGYAAISKAVADVRIQHKIDALKKQISELDSKVKDLLDEREEIIKRFGVKDREYKVVR